MTEPSDRARTASNTAGEPHERLGATASLDVQESTVPRADDGDSDGRASQGAGSAPQDTSSVDEDTAPASEASATHESAPAAPHPVEEDAASAPSVAGADDDVPCPGAAGDDSAGPGSRPSAGHHRQRAHHDARERRRRRRLTVAVVTLAVLVALAGTGIAYLWRTSDAWEGRAEAYRGEAAELGTELATTRAELEGARSELAAVRDQLSTANTRIAELANEKAQVGDDREAQRQLADYQERVTEAAGDVALALDQCVQGQQQLITYLRAQADAPPDQKPYDEAALTQYATDVDTLCQAATEANATLQTELER